MLTHSNSFKPRLYTSEGMFMQKFSQWLPPNLSFNPDPTVRDNCHALNLRLSVGPVNFVR